ncbi:hypothetical protein BCR33DRAFT_742809 [Rhizoclosmatium globosum]|uniref:Uncharacterized protein n=1 Tax=Rhizoclosmatium globosum TaxID=329046 RepID=A0A1Y2BND6_9FUNG|nr:hypothetical protein BCR33DRAFT_742809 [Rhizoclosmatium globosum]|eukprot:ORY36268.1 hypothetical protein BCR33DRAFT_742809 [Rhizoclosmatium globosum]
MDGYQAALRFIKHLEAIVKEQSEQIHDLHEEIGTVNHGNSELEQKLKQVTASLDQLRQMQVLQGTIEDASQSGSKRRHSVQKPKLSIQFNSEVMLLKVGIFNGILIKHTDIL